jgi:hypothetical protein
MTKCQMTRVPTCVALIEELRYNLWNEVFDGTGDGKVIVGVRPTCIAGRFRDKRGAFLYAQIERPVFMGFNLAVTFNICAPQHKRKLLEIAEKGVYGKGGFEANTGGNFYTIKIGSSYVRHAFHSSVPFADRVLG